MKVKCPKCSEIIAIEGASVSDEGYIVVLCSECGTRFRFKPKTVEKKNKPESDDSPFIMIADDTKFFRTMIKDLFEQQGFKVLTAEDGEDAFNKIKSNYDKLDLVLLDLLMPKLSGFDVIRKVRDFVSSEDLPILAMTRIYSSHEDIEELRNIGANGYVRKSDDTDLIIFRVKQTLGMEE